MELTAKYKHTFINSDDDAIDGYVTKEFIVDSTSYKKAVGMLQRELVTAYRAFDITIKALKESE